MGYRNNTKDYMPRSVRKALDNINKSECEGKVMQAIADIAVDRNDEANASHFLHALMHTWNLPVSIQQKLKVYELRAMYASQIQENLKHHTGLFGFKGKTYVPIYQNCSRMEIGRQANSATPAAYKYYVSFREYGAIRIALIQLEF